MSRKCARSRGREFEDLAKRWLEKRGLRTVTRNYTCRLGELDLVMQDHEYVVIVEVKFRGRDALVSGPESVTSVKQSRLIRTTMHFLQCHPDLQAQPVRFDLISVTEDSPGRKIDWIRDAFTPRL